MKKGLFSPSIPGQTIQKNKEIKISGDALNLLGSNVLKGSSIVLSGKMLML